MMPVLNEVKRTLSQTKKDLTPIPKKYKAGGIDVFDETGGFAKVPESGVSEVIIKAVKKIHEIPLSGFQTRDIKRKKLRYPTNSSLEKFKEFKGSKEIHLKFHPEGCRDYVKIIQIIPVRNERDQWSKRVFYVDLSQEGKESYPIYPYFPKNDFSLKEAKDKIRQLKVSNPFLQIVTAAFNRHGVVVSGREGVNWASPEDDCMKRVDDEDTKAFCHFQDTEPLLLNGEPATRINLASSVR